MKRIIPAFGVPLVLSVGLIQGDARLPLAAPPAPAGDKPLLAPSPPPKLPEQSLTLIPPATALRRALPETPSLGGPGDKIPHSYTVYGLRTGPGGMAFTDQNGVALPVPSEPRLLIGPEAAPPVVPYYSVPNATVVLPRFSVPPVLKK